MGAHEKYDVIENTQLGRYLVAKTDLKLGEIIMVDRPYAVGPQMQSNLMCFSCHRPLKMKFSCCKVCGIAPMCPEWACTAGNALTWHDSQECSLFKEMKKKNLNALAWVQNIDALLVLRCLLKSLSDAESWEKFCRMESHLEERRDSSIWKYYEDVVEFIQSIDYEKNWEEPDLIQKVCGIIDVNSFELRAPSISGEPQQESLRGIYLNSALMAHDCIGNTIVSIGENNMMTVRAAIRIKEGDPIIYNYTNMLQGTLGRQRHLNIGKYFTCTCIRCSDPTELSSHMSSLICQSCGTGLVVNCNPTSDADEGQWKCLSCGEKFESVYNNTIVNEMARRLQLVDKSDDVEMEKYLKSTAAVLGPNHYLVLDAKQALAGLLRDRINREINPPNKLLARKIQLCKDLLDVLEKICPPLSRLRAVTLYELHATSVILANKLYDAREISSSQLLNNLRESERLLKSSIEMLVMEPGDSPEGALCSKAFEDLKNLKATIQSIADNIQEENCEKLSKS